ncbi:MAG: AMP-dependent synthetase/ligase, partial [Alphaproteobacteria bacterium]
VKELVQKSVDKVNAELAKYETIKKFHLAPVEFTQENDMLTPTLKVKRKIVNKHFAKNIEGMYEH